jgi:hypothetical protein
MEAKGLMGRGSVCKGRSEGKGRGGSMYTVWLLLKNVED